MICIVHLRVVFVVSNLLSYAFVLFSCSLICFRVSSCCFRALKFAFVCLCVVFVLSNFLSCVFVFLSRTRIYFLVSYCFLFCLWCFFSLMLLLFFIFQKGPGIMSNSLYIASTFQSSFKLLCRILWEVEFVSSSQVLRPSGMMLWFSFAVLLAAT